MIKGNLTQRCFYVVWMVLHYVCSNDVPMYSDVSEDIIGTTA